MTSAPKARSCCAARCTYGRGVTCGKYRGLMGGRVQSVLRSSDRAKHLAYTYSNLHVGAPVRADDYNIAVDFLLEPPDGLADPLRHAAAAVAALLLCVGDNVMVGLKSTNVCQCSAVRSHQVSVRHARAVIGGSELSRVVREADDANLDALVGQDDRAPRLLHVAPGARELDAAGLQVVERVEEALLAVVQRMVVGCRCCGTG